MKIIPYLSFDGACAEAFAFYAKALRGTIGLTMTYADSPMGVDMTPQDRAKIMHVRLDAGTTQLMGADAPPHLKQKPQGFNVSIMLADPTEAHRIFEALGEGGMVQMPIGATFWSPAFGMVTDRFGTPWMVNCEPAMDEAPSAS